MSLWFSSLYSLDESFWVQQELSASLGMGAGGSRGTHGGLSGQGLAQLWGARDQPCAVLLGQRLYFPWSSPCSSVIHCSCAVWQWRQTSWWIQTGRQTDSPQPPTARSPVAAHIVVMCLWIVCRDGKEREKDKPLFQRGEMKYEEYLHQTQTEMGKDSAWQMKCHQCFRWTH